MHFVLAPLLLRIYICAALLIIMRMHTCPGDLSTSMWVSRDDFNFQPYYSHSRWRIYMSRKISLANFCTVANISGEFAKALKMTFLGLKTIYILKCNIDLAIDSHLHYSHIGSFWWGSHYDIMCEKLHIWINYGGVFPSNLPILQFGYCFFYPNYLCVNNEDINYFQAQKCHF